MCTLLYSNSISGHISRETLIPMQKENCLKDGHCFIVCNYKKLGTIINSGICELIVDYVWYKIRQQLNEWTRFKSINRDKSQKHKTKCKK